MHLNRKIMLVPAICFAAAACCPTMLPPASQGRFTLFFSEFSADLSADTHGVIDRAATESKKQGVRSIRIEARANATGSADATMKIAETRAAVVRDALLADGVPNGKIKSLAIGQGGTTDMGVAPRRVDIILEK